MAKTDEELLALLADLETDQVERKESLRSGDASERVCQAICAFANDLPDHRNSGVIFVGATDAGLPSGLAIDDRLLLQLADLRGQGRILPPPIMSVRKLDVGTRSVAVVEVEPSPTPPVRFNGQVWIRVGPRRALATADEERRLAERRRSADLPFDARPAVGSTIEDLDLGLFEREYLPSVLTAEVVAANSRTTEQRLSSLRLTSVDGAPTHAGLLVLGVEPTNLLPGAYVQFLRVDGLELDAPIIDERRLSTALPSLLRELDELLKLNIRTSVRIGNQLRDARHPDYPLAALQQLTRNAILHRSYEATASPVRLYLVQRPRRDLFTRRTLRRRDGRELRPAGRDRLPKSDPRRSDERARICAEVRCRSTHHPRCLGRQRKSAGRLQTRSYIRWSHREGSDMSARMIAFFNNKGGVGKTSLVFHLAWMMARKGLSVVAADLDPQANLTANFLEEKQMESLWPGGNAVSEPGETIFGSLAPLIRATGDIADPPLREIVDGLHLLPGDLALSGFEDELSSQWPGCLDRKERSFRVISAFWRLLARAGEQVAADVVLVDVGPNLGATNRSALLAADFVVIPLAPDLFSVRGLQNLGPSLRTWRDEWAERVPRNPAPDLPLPRGDMTPIGYVLLQHGVRLGQTVQAYQRWMDRIPGVYRGAVLDVTEQPPAIGADPQCLAQIKHYRSLMPMSYEVHKPVFDLKPADGAFGGHQAAVGAARDDFANLTDRILERTEPGLTSGTRRRPV